MIAGFVTLDRSGKVSWNLTSFTGKLGDLLRKIENDLLQPPNFYKMWGNLTVTVKRTDYHSLRYQYVAVIHNIVVLKQGYTEISHVHEGWAKI